MPGWRERGMMGKWQDHEIELVKLNYQTLEYKDIASVLGRNETSVRNLCWKMGWRKRHEFWTDKEIEILREHYQGDEINLDALEVLFSRDKANISRKARELGLTNQNRKKSRGQIRKMSLLVKEWHKTHEHPKGHRGKTHTESTRELMSKGITLAWANPDSKLNSDERSQACSDRMTAMQKEGKLRQGYSSGRMGRRDDLDGKYFRSAWEANYARYLNWLISIGQIAKWEFEPDVFEFHAIKRGTRSYLPDFKVYGCDGSIEYHEVKGWMDQKSKTKLDRMAKYYPEVKIVLIDKDVYRAIAKQVKGFIPFWEG
jgi:hypothetical protein